MTCFCCSSNQIRTRHFKLHNCQLKHSVMTTIDLKQQCGSINWVTELDQQAVLGIGYSELKSKRLDAMAISGKDVFVVLPMGFGESLTYATLPLAYDSPKTLWLSSFLLWLLSWSTCLRTTAGMASIYTTIAFHKFIVRYITLGCGYIISHIYAWHQTLPLLWRGWPARRDFPCTSCSVVVEAS